MSKVKIYIEETDETFELNVEGSVSKVEINTTKGIYSVVKNQEKKNVTKEELDDISNSLENLFGQFKHKTRN